MWELQSEKKNVFGTSWKWLENWMETNDTKKEEIEEEIGRKRESIQSIVVNWWRDYQVTRYDRRPDQPNPISLCVS